MSSLSERQRRPADALRQATPYFWAAFERQGDWR
jgi:hypothetical protein